jgi:hypothetical protein
MSTFARTKERRETEAMRTQRRRQRRERIESEAKKERNTKKEKKKKKNMKKKKKKKIGSEGAKEVEQREKDHETDGHREEVSTSASFQESEQGASKRREDVEENDEEDSENGERGGKSQKGKKRTSRKRASRRGKKSKAQSDEEESRKSFLHNYRATRRSFLHKGGVTAVEDDTESGSQEDSAEEGKSESESSAAEKSDSGETGRPRMLFGRGNLSGEGSAWEGTSVISDISSLTNMSRHSRFHPPNEFTPNQIKDLDMYERQRRSESKGESHSRGGSDGEVRRRLTEKKEEKERRRLRASIRQIAEEEAERTNRREKIRREEEELKKEIERKRRNGQQGKGEKKGNKEYSSGLFKQLAIFETRLKEAFKGSRFKGGDSYAKVQNGLEAIQGAARRVGIRLSHLNVVESRAIAQSLLEFVVEKGTKLSRHLESEDKLRDGLSYTEVIEAIRRKNRAKTPITDFIRGLRASAPAVVDESSRQANRDYFLRSLKSGRKIFQEVWRENRSHLLRYQEEFDMKKLNRIQDGPTKSKLAIAEESLKRYEKRLRALTRTKFPMERPTNSDKLDGYFWEREVWQDEQDRRMGQIEALITETESQIQQWKGTKSEALSEVKRWKDETAAAERLEDARLQLICCGKIRWIEDWEEEEYQFSPKGLLIIRQLCIPRTFLNKMTDRMPPWMWETAEEIDAEMRIQVMLDLRESSQMSGSKDTRAKPVKSREKRPETKKSPEERTSRKYVRWETFEEQVLKATEFGWIKIPETQDFALLPKLEGGAMKKMKEAIIPALWNKFGMWCKVKWTKRYPNKQWVIPPRPDGGKTNNKLSTGVRTVSSAASRVDVTCFEERSRKELSTGGVSQKHYSQSGFNALRRPRFGQINEQAPLIDRM